MYKRLPFIIPVLMFSFVLLGGMLTIMTSFSIAPLYAAAPSTNDQKDLMEHTHTFTDVFPLYLTATILMEQLDNGNLVELTPVMTNWWFDHFYILPEEASYTLWLNNKYQPAGSRVAVEQHLQSEDGLIWYNRTDTNLVDNVPDSNFLRGIRQVIKEGDLYHGWEAACCNLVDGYSVGKIRYISSTDGIMWTIVNDPALNSGEDFNVRKEGSIYQMWATPSSPNSSWNGPRMLRYRTSTQPGSGWGHWATGGAAVNVDGEEVRLQNRVMKLSDGTYQLFYRPYQAANSQIINLAISSDGINFTQIVSGLVDYANILPDYLLLEDFMVADVAGEDWFYFTYIDIFNQGRIAVVRPEQAIMGLTAVNDSPTPLGDVTALTATITNGTNVQYTWNFGDGLTGSGAAPVHTYSAPGIYTAVVTASNAVNMATATTLVHIIEPVANLFAWNNSPTPLGNFTELSATLSTGSDVTYTWDFGDGQMGGGMTLTHTYSNGGTYMAVVTATNSVSTLTATTTVEIVDVAISGLTAMNDGPTLWGHVTTLSANVVLGTGVNYTWNLGDNTIVTGAVVTHTYALTGTYMAVVTASNTANALSANTTVIVYTEPPLTPFYALYLPIVHYAAAPPSLFPVQISPVNPFRPVNQMGEVFYTANVQIPGDVPSNGRFYLSSSPVQAEPIVVDDRLTLQVGSTTYFVYQFAESNDPIPLAEIVEVPRQVVETMAGQSIMVVFQDVFGTNVGSSQVWLIWEP